MIVRVLGQGRYRLDESEMTSIERLDSDMVAALDASDGAAFERVLHELVATVQARGELIPADDLTPSALVVPHPDATMEEVRSLLAEGS